MYSNSSLSQTATTIVFIDASLSDYQTLQTGIVEGVKSVIISPNQDGIEQISQILQQHPHITTIHILSHGAPGCLYLGNSQLNLTNIHNYTQQLQQWQRQNILLYGCNVAAGDAGEEFIHKLHQITNATISASTTKTGNAALGGNWQLEVNIPATETFHGTSLHLSDIVADTLNSYQGVFAPTLKGNYDTSGQAFGVQVVGNYAYVASHDKGLEIIDISNPTTPTLKGNYDTSGAAWGVQVVGNYAYVADDNSGLQIIDISNPTTPTLKGNYDTSGYAYGVKVVGNYAYVADDNSGLQIIDVSEFINKAPTNLTLSTSTVAENEAIGKVVGTFKTTDPDLADTFTYSLVAGTGSTDNTLFTVVGNQLKTNAVFDYETKNSYSVRVRTTDQGGLFSEKQLNIAINNTDESANLSQYANSVIGFSSEYGTDGWSANQALGAPDTSTYGDIPTSWAAEGENNTTEFLTLGFNTPVYATGVTIRETYGNGFVSKIETLDLSNAYQQVWAGIDGSLQGSTADFTVNFAQTNYLVKGVRITVNPLSSTSWEEIDAVQLHGTANQTPTNIILTNNNIAENQVIGTVVGNLTTTDPDTGDTFTYSLVTGDGATDNSLFTITNNQLKTNSVFDYETKNSYSVRVRTTDQGGLFFEQQLTIGVTDLNEDESFTTTAQQDIIDAQDGNDTITSTWGNLQQNDTIKGGNGTDTLIITGGTVNDIISIDISNTSNQLDIPGTTVCGFERFDLTSFTGTVSFSGTAGNDWVKGGTGNDDLSGGMGDDYLNGGTGADLLGGGRGNDTYVVDNVGDIIAEFLNQGIDTVESSITWTLKNHLENLTLTGTTAINGTGNTLNNTLIGNTGNNTLNGGLGNDTLNGNLGNDTLIGGVGNDSYYVDNTADTITELVGQGVDSVFSTAATYTLSANVENLTLQGTTAINGIGNTLNNIITGNAADNVLTGGTGADTLIGGAGNDSYYVDNTADSITENANEGTDSVFSTVTYTLTTNTENLTLQGTTAINGTGNELNNIITGNTGNNVLTGGLGNDTLTGNAGSDTLIGGLGNDSLYLGLNDNVVDNVNYVLGDATDTVYQFVRGVGGDKLNFTGIANFDVITSGTSTLVRVGDGIGGNTGFGTGQLLVTLSATSGFTSANANFNLFGGNFLFN
ncbi:DUF4347 domain-containing protein [Dolichospermum circinale]|uniref:DUF4347 domain-containing protein n=1 Tax=Dolichospermum circinale TaxID=109265 RepID=UPI00232CF461|nr:DUF4347 domain-containing protein [Dolichospermum circinale]MDB9449748.1 DUF4347 domain-containing protein [Dolichospermum circinale CS-547]